MEDNKKTKGSDALSNLRDKLKERAGALWEKAKSSKITVIAIFSAAVVVLLALVLVTVFAARPDTPQPLTPRDAIAYEELSRQIRLALFDFNIGADSLTESFTITGGRNTYLVRIRAGEDEHLIREIHEICREGGLSVASAGMRVTAEAPTYRADIILEAPEQTVSPVELPVTTDPVPVTTPAKTTDRFGNPLPPKGNGQIALLIDDCGMNMQLAERLTSMNIPMAFAILPHMPYSRETAALVRKNGKKVFLHFPMEPESYPATDPGPGAVLLTMPETLIEAVTKSNVENIGFIDGANNHTGSALTADETKIRQALMALSQYTDTFIDSNTTNKSVALKVCQELGMKCGLNRKFLDNENDHKYIAAKLYEAAALTQKEGGIIAIGHLRPDTVAVLEEIVPQLQALGYTFVSISTFTK